MNLNSFNRWAAVFSNAAREVITAHIEEGGTLKVDDPSGLTVEQFKARLMDACPGEPLPSDEALHLRLQLLEILMSRQRLIEAVATVNEIGRGVVAELEAIAGETLDQNPFDDGRDARVH